MTEVRIQCFLCSARILYEKKDTTALLDHLRSEHSADSGENYLIAGCLMNPEEREAIVNVVKDRQPDTDGEDDVPPEAYNEEPDEVAVAEDEVGEVSEATEGNIEVHRVVSLASLVPETTLQEDCEDLQPAGLLAFGEASPPRVEVRGMVEFPCPECDLSFKLKIKLNRHLKLHAKKEELKSELTVKTEVKTERLTPKKFTGARVWNPTRENEGVPCTDCGKRFRTRPAMQRHFEDIHQPGEFPCRGCGKMFTSKNKQSSHYSRHCNPNRRKLSV